MPRKWRKHGLFRNRRLLRIHRRLRRTQRAAIRIDRGAANRLGRKLAQITLVIGLGEVRGTLQLLQLGGVVFGAQP
jgi:hypothetical protein